MPAPKRNLKPQTPGKAPEVETEVELELEEEYEDDQGEDDPEDTITLTVSQLRDLISETVEEEVGKRIIKQARDGASPARTNPAVLPRQDEIDVTKINRSVLTQDGWVCPLIHPSDRGHKRSDLIN